MATSRKSQLTTPLHARCSATSTSPVTPKSLPRLRASAAWLWAAASRQSSPAFRRRRLHGKQWVDGSRAVELSHDNRHRASRDCQSHSDAVPRGRDRCIIDGCPVQTACADRARSRLLVPNHDGAWPRIDAVEPGKQKSKTADIESLTRQDMSGAGELHELVACAGTWLDAGSQSPKESWLRIGPDRSRSAETSDADSGS